MIDRITSRLEMKRELALLIRHLSPHGMHAPRGDEQGAAAG